MEITGQKRIDEILDKIDFVIAFIEIGMECEEINKPNTEDYYKGYLDALNKVKIIVDK